MKPIYLPVAIGLMLAGAGLLAPAEALFAQQAQGKAAVLTVGVIYDSTKHDYGYNQTHALGAAALKKLPDVIVKEVEDIPTTAAVQKVMEEMITKDGVKVIFATSYAYLDPHVTAIAKKYPEVAFFHLGKLFDAKKHPKNVHSYFGHVDECEYISGIVAAHASKSKKLGFVASRPLGQVLRNINAFTLGARSVNMDITSTAVFTNAFTDGAKEAAATNKLIDEGCDVITCHVDIPKTVMEVAEKRGVKSCGLLINQAALAPKGYLTGAEWNLEKVYVDFVNDFKAGKSIPGLKSGGLQEGMVRMSPFGPLVSAEAHKAADAAAAEFTAGRLVIFKGPLRDNAGKTRIAEGTTYLVNATELDRMNYLVEGVKGNTSAK